MRKFKKGDIVKILSGKERGKTGEIVVVLPKQNRVVVKGINIVTKHRKQTATHKGGLSKVEAPISISKIMLIDKEIGKPTRVKFAFGEKDGKKHRVSVKNGKKID